MTQLQIGTTARTKASPAPTLLALPSWLGGPAVNVPAGSGPLCHLQSMPSKSLPDHRAPMTGWMPPDQPDVAGMRYLLATHT